ncbi:MAG: hypothetical protein RL885_12790 [Planctomycetota bacterium]
MSWTAAWEWQTLFAVDDELIPRAVNEFRGPVHEHQRRWLVPGKRHLDLSLVGGETVRLRVLGAEKGDLQLWRSRCYSHSDGERLVKDLADLGLLPTDAPFDGWSRLEESLRVRHPRLVTISLEQSVSEWSFADCRFTHGRFVAGGQRSHLLKARAADRKVLERTLAPRLLGLYPACDSVRALLDLVQRARI